MIWAIQDTENYIQKALQKDLKSPGFMKCLEKNMNVQKIVHSQKILHAQKKNNAKKKKFLVKKVFWSPRIEREQVLASSAFIFTTASKDRTWLLIANKSFMDKDACGSSETHLHITKYFELGEQCCIVKSK